jgi:membrane protein implicated in regulation of membrane protease activity
MSALRMPHPMSRHPEMARAIRDGFWVIALGAIGCYAFFVALGAIKPGQVAGVSIAIGVLFALWLARAWSQSHLKRMERDPRLAHARERRGF